MNQRRDPDDPREWIRRARSNLAIAQSVVADAYLEDLCFDAQQAAEKAIKAIFVARGEAFPYVHELKKLLKHLHANGQKIPKYIWQADKLSDFAVWTRYPTTERRVTKREYRSAVRIAASVVTWAERQVESTHKMRRRKK